MTTAVEWIQLAGDVAPLVAVPVAGWIANAAVRVMRNRLHIQFSDKQVAAIHAAASTAAGIATAMLASGKLTMDELHTQAPALRELARDAINAVPDSTDAQSVMVSDMARLIVGRIGQMISADPTIPTVPPQPTTQKDPTHA